jgi:uncharacterized protein (TIGR02145 family)
MAENLAHKVEGSKLYDFANKEKYSRLYDWYAANKDGRLYNWNAANNACPPGWHLPSNEEWQTLVDFAGGEKIAGEKLKSKSGWKDNNGKSGNGTDDFGFSALPGGLGSSNVDLGYDDLSYDDIGLIGYWWTTTVENGGPLYRFMSHNKSCVGKGNGAEFFSVRCVKD